MFALTVCGWPDKFSSPNFLIFDVATRRPGTDVLCNAFVDSFCQPETRYAFENIEKTCRNIFSKTSLKAGQKVRQAGNESACEGGTQVLTS